MSVRLIQFTAQTTRAVESEHPSLPVQLSLFDFRPCLRVLCLPMGDLHGETFLRAVRFHRPHTVVDLRSHPYFDLHSLGREAAFDAFRDTCATYRHRPLDLRAGSVPAERWRVMGEATSLFTELAPDEITSASFAILHHRRAECSFIEGALAQVGRERVNWEIVSA